MAKSDATEPPSPGRREEKRKGPPRFPGAGLAVRLEPERYAAAVFAAGAGWPGMGGIRGANSLS